MANKFTLTFTGTNGDPWPGLTRVAGGQFDATIDTNQGAPECALMKSSAEPSPLTLAAYSMSVDLGSWCRSRKRIRVSWVQGSW